MKQEIYEALGAECAEMVKKEISNFANSLPEIVQKEIAKIPKPQDGKDGRDGVDGAKGLDGAPGINGKDGVDGINGKDGIAGEPGKDGAPGKDGEKGLDGAPGKDGVNGVDGKDGVDGINGENGKDGRDGENGKDGRDGENGKDGVSPTPEAVAAAMEGHFAKWALEFERRANDMIARFVDAIPRPKDGVDGKDGRDAMSLDSFDIRQSDDLKTVTVSFKSGLTTIEKSIKLAQIMDKGVFRPGEKYCKGDAVTYGGALWIVQNDNPEGAPSTSKDFRLAVKRGRDGRDTVRIKKAAEPVKIGGDDADAGNA